MEHKPTQWREQTYQMKIVKNKAQTYQMKKSNKQGTDLPNKNSND